MNIRIKTFEYTNKRGFTLLESIVAILVLSLAISGVFSSVRQGLSQGTIAKEDVKAFYLAQEAVELVRHVRDNNQINRLRNGPSQDNVWLRGIAYLPTDPCYTTVCKADALEADSATALTPCGVTFDSCPMLNQDPNTRLFSYSPGSPTNFRREIQIVPVWLNTEPGYNDGLVDEIAVIVRVTWSKGLIQREFKAKTFLFDWVVTPKS